MPFDALAQLFFDVDPVTGEMNTDPLRACKRRLQVLATAGFIWPTAFSANGRPRAVAMLGPASAGVVGAKPERQRVPVNKRSHHLRTLDALMLVNREAGARGERVLKTSLESELRFAQQGGRFTRHGDTLDAVPDAACVVEDARGHRREVAVEYVTSKYTDEDIARKRDAFAATYDRVLWFADRPRTAERVRRITGMPCTTLR